MLVEPNGSKLSNYFIGWTSGLVSPIFGTPLQVVKISVQTTTNKDVKNSAEYIKENYLRNGLIGFYRGFIANVMKDSLFGMSFIGHYYTLRDYLGSDVWWKNFVSGASAHYLTWYTLIPIDYVKTKIQQSEKRRTITEVIRSSYRVGGIRIFWRGVFPACLRTIPVSGVAMVGYETVRNVLSEEN